ncbi:HMA2 domain-containing protein [Clostridium kluyveri]|uniref:Uncharacterized protein n=1 Tax=Clostridium kluyveri TaxID=1534 RepID=A0A1L5F690_CLOKL|nr:hypothetical protein [Clostridium kluyveri]APM38525.1 hypothetical protein BS101_07120 [Clostridium kluyveri]UZQ50822.1 hypothetical protein OP486_01205 [Clostridium kluyveri]
MENLKKHIFKYFAKVKLVHSMPGRLRLKLVNVSNIPEEYSYYIKYLKDALCILPGIDKVKFNHVIGTILIEYSVDKAHEEKILKWIDTIIKVGSDNFQLIKDYGENDLEYVVDTLEQQLKDVVHKI